MTVATLLDREDIIDGLGDLIAELRTAGEEAGIRLVGGAALALRYIDRGTTQDLDSLHILPGTDEAVTAAAARVDRVGGGLRDDRTERIRNSDPNRPVGSLQVVPVAPIDGLSGGGRLEDRPLRPPRRRTSLHHDVDGLLAAMEAMEHRPTEWIYGAESDGVKWSGDSGDGRRGDIQQKIDILGGPGRTWATAGTDPFSPSAPTSADVAARGGLPACHPIM